MMETLPECGWRDADPVAEGLMVCRNTINLHHQGVVPRSFCEKTCPARYRKPDDYQARCQRLLVDLHARGELLPVISRSCTGCPPVRVRPLQFVWPYYHDAAISDELRWSIRSVVKNYRGEVKITIVGDSPPWYRGHLIRCPRVSKRSDETLSQRRYRDMQHKMRTIAHHPEIDPQWIWMMDDVMLIRPTNLHDLSQPRGVPWRGSSDANTWQEIKTRTMQILIDSGMPTIDYATHGCHLVETSKLRELMDIYPPETGLFLWENLYGNRYWRDPRPVVPWLRRIRNPLDLAGWLQLVKTHTCLNYSDVCWDKGLNDFFRDQFPEPYGEDGLPTGTWTKRKPKRQVKRRPVETHRSFLERAKDD